MSENTGPVAALDRVACDLEEVAQALDRLMTERLQLAGELVRIDDELGRLYERLADDRRMPVPPMPISEDVLSLTIRTGRRIVPAQHSCQYDVLVAVLTGAQTPRGIRQALPRWSADRVKQACTHLVESGWLQRTGATTTIRYAVASVTTATQRTA